jgi:hypothetical protein
MLHTIKRDRSTLIFHQNDEMPYAVIWNKYGWDGEQPTIHDMRFSLNAAEDSFCLYLGYADITDLMELLVQVKLTMQKEADKNAAE